MIKQKSLISIFIKEKRKQYGYTQKEFSLRSGLGLRFVRELEQGKTTLRMDKVNKAINFFGYQLDVKQFEDGGEEEETKSQSRD